MLSYSAAYIWDITISSAFVHILYIVSTIGLHNVFNARKKEPGFPDSVLLAYYSLGGGNQINNALDRPPLGLFRYASVELHGGGCVFVAQELLDFF